MSSAAANTFTPTTQTVDPPNRPDQLSGALLDTLDRARFAYRARPWGLIKTAILSILTLGLLPLFCWPRRLWQLACIEQQQFGHLAEWLRLRTGRAEATALQDYAANDLKPSPFLPAITLFIPIAAAIILIQSIAGGHLELHHFAPIGRNFHRHVFLPVDNSNFWRGWTLFLCIGYFLHWFQVCRRAGQLAHFADLFNKATAAENIPPVIVRGVGIGFNVFWAIAAVAGLCFGAIWAIPLALAGVVHARYVRLTSRQTRAEFARRVRVMLQSTRPAIDIRPAPCINKLCRAPIPAGAAFCPRCGARTT